MSEKSRDDLTPEERRRRAAIRKRKQQEMKRRKRQRMILSALVIAAIVVILILLGILIYKLLGSGQKQVTASGDTYVIALDPGHGGTDIGVNSDTSYEKDIDLAVCEKLQVMLESQGYEVVMIRSGDDYLSKDERVVEANKSGADILVSVHCNYSDTDDTLSGVKTTYTKGDKAAKTLAANIVNNVAAQTAAENLGAETGEYTILEETDMTAVLVEIGYLSNSAEAANLDDDTYINSVAKGIAYGIIASLAD